MALHTFVPVSVIKCKYEALKNSKNLKYIQVTGFTILICPMSCCVRINHNQELWLLNGDMHAVILSKMSSE